MKTEIRQFSERIGGGNWNYTTTKGEVVPCDEDTIEKIWNKWIMDMGAKKRTKAGFTVFIFSKEPLMINL